MVPMTAEEEAEAKRMAEIALRAEQRAAERAAQKERESQPSSVKAISGGVGATFMTKQQREQLALEKLEVKRRESEQRAKEAAEAHQRFISGQALEERNRAERLQQEQLRRDQERRRQEGNKDKLEAEAEQRAIRHHYLGGGDDLDNSKRRPANAAEKTKSLFRQDWDTRDDTARLDVNPLYRHRLQVNPLLGRGFVAGVDHEEQLNSHHQEHQRQQKQSLARPSGAGTSLGTGTSTGTGTGTGTVKGANSGDNRLQDGQRNNGLGQHWTEKPLSAMTQRDWRIFREDYDIRIQGGRAVNPLRAWSEAQLPSPLLQAVNAMGYKEPSPIQRQSIPIGLAYRDVIGIAETGSGKTAAFVLPLLAYLLRLPASFIARCADEGPLAVVLAPTRELAQQIDEECIKLSAYTSFATACVVGGVAIEEQSVRLRAGVHVVIGTPGRMVDCIASNFLVLNQCGYVVLDEADRMIDMGFEGQVRTVLDAMGGLLKSEDEEAAEKQLSAAAATAGQLTADSRSLIRVTAMFSATMPPEVERIAKSYLRHPAIIKIGDEDSGKNKRIEQRVALLSEPQKKTRIVDELRRLNLSRDDKAIVFVNAKKQADVIGRVLESAGINVDVLHGGKGQDQREETLEGFRRGTFRVLVATDVAGRGLDIPDVSHVFNYDCPSKIENYCHRIGRTGRAGKSGIALTFLTDADAEVMPELKAYLESTGAVVPQQLKQHPAVQAGAASKKRGRDQIG